MTKTMKDVAIRAGVSVTTVSHVINKTRFVSDDLTRRVMQAMEELNYRPNNLARSLRMGETRTIGLIVPDNSNPFFAEVARIVEDIGFEKGYGVFLCNSDDLIEKEAAYVNMLVAKQVDGVIFIAAGNSEKHLLELTRRNIPVVVVDRDLPHSLVDVVQVNNEQGGYEAVRFLLELGHRRIACITGPSVLTPSAQRVHGYRRALSEAGIPYRGEYILQGDFRPRSGETAASRLLQLAEPPTAIFACNDLMAIGVLRALRNRNLRAPEDISIVGFDDIPLAAEVSPALTSMAQPIAEMATFAAELLIDRILGSRPVGEHECRLFDPKLVVRDSCAPVSSEV